MTVNVPLLGQVMAHITDHPEQHDQSTWVSECGTAACFAGWACLLSGWTVRNTFMTGATAVSPSPDLTRISIAAAATDLLGLDTDDSRTLFRATNTRPMLALMVKDLVNGEPLRDDDEYRAEAEGWDA